MDKFLIDDKLVDHTTYRTRIIEKYCKIKNQTFYDIGAGEAFESIAIAHRGAKQVTAIEGKEHFYDLAKKALKKKKFSNCKLKKFDARDVNKLEPVSFQFKKSREDDTPTGTMHYGFKAQDILALEGDNNVIIDN